VAAGDGARLGEGDDIKVLFLDLGRDIFGPRSGQVGFGAESSGTEAEILPW